MNAHPPPFYPYPTHSSVPLPYAVLPVYPYYPHASYPPHPHGWAPAPYQVPVPYYVYTFPSPPMISPQPLPAPVLCQVQNHPSQQRTPFVVSPQENVRPASASRVAPREFAIPTRPPRSPHTMREHNSTAAAPPRVFSPPGVIPDVDIRNALHRAGITKNRKERALAAKRTLAQMPYLPTTRNGPSMTVARAVLNPANVIFKTDAPSSEDDRIERWNQNEWYLGPLGKTAHFQGARPKKRGSRAGQLKVDRASLRHTFLKHKCQLELNQRSRKLDLPEVFNPRLVTVRDGVNRTFARPGHTQARPSKLCVEIKRKRPVIPRRIRRSRIAA